MKVVVINGTPESGKDTFVDFCKTANKQIGIISYSTIDTVKKIAGYLGWDGRKTELDRKFLAELKSAITNWDEDFFIKEIRQIINLYKSVNYQLVLFVFCREPWQIKKIVENFNAATLLIERKDKKGKQSNIADSSVFNYNYDYKIKNNLTLKELQLEADNFLEQLRKDDKHEMCD